MGEDADGEEGSDESGGPAGMLLMIGTLDLVLLGIALYAFSLGEPTVSGGILTLALVLTGIDVFLYRRGSF